MAQNKIFFYGIAGAVSLVILYIAWKGWGGAAQAVTRAVTDAAGGAASGVVLGASDTIGIPETDAQKCAQAVKNGNTWDASLYCPAGTFLRSIFMGADTASANGWNSHFVQ